MSAIFFMPQCDMMSSTQPPISSHNYIIVWKPCYWPFVRGIHWSPVVSNDRGPVMRTFQVFLFFTWTNCWTNNRIAVIWDDSWIWRYCNALFQMPHPWRRYAVVGSLVLSKPNKGWVWHINPLYYKVWDEIAYLYNIFTRAHHGHFTYSWRVCEVTLKIIAMG